MNKFLRIWYEHDFFDVFYEWMLFSSKKCEKNVKKKIWIKYKPDLNSINYVKIIWKKYYIICENII